MSNIEISRDDSNNIKSLSYYCEDNNTKTVKRITNNYNKGTFEFKSKEDTNFALVGNVGDMYCIQ